jgi:hypothetical protein
MLSFKDSGFELLERNENPTLFGNIPNSLFNYFKTNNLDFNNISSNHNNFIIGNFDKTQTYEWKFIKVFSTESISYTAHKVKPYYDSSFFCINKESNIYNCYWAVKNNPLDKKNISLFLSGLVVGLMVYNYVPRDKEGLNKILNFEDMNLNISDIQQNLSTIYEKINYFNQTFNKEKKK